MEGFNFLSFLEAAYRRKWFVAAPVVLCTAAAAIVAVLLPSHYRSSTLILVEQQQVSTSYVTPTDATPFNQRLNTIRQQILSRPNLEKIIKNFDLYSGDGTQLAKEDAIARLVSKIEVKLIGERRAEDAFSISFSGTDPYTTMQVASTLASMFIEENLKRREQYAEGTTGFLSDELEQAKSELEKQEQAVRTFKEKYMGGLPQQLEANLRTLDRLQLELQSVKLDLKSAEDKKALLESPLNQTNTMSAAPGAPANPLVSELESRQRELAGLLSAYNENYPDVIITRRRIEELRQLLTSSSEGAQPAPQSNKVISAQVRNPEAYNNLLNAESQIKALKNRESDIRRQISMLERRVDATPANEQRFADLNRDYQISLNNYQSLLEKRLNARLAENLEKRQKGERFRIINPANLPERPYKPNRPLVVMAGAGIGAGIGFGLVFLLEFLNPAFKRPEDFEGVLDMDLLATVPAFDSLPEEGHSKGGFLKKVTKGKWAS